MFCTTREAASLVGCTLRQVQYWRTKGLVVPVVNPEGTGHSAYYSEENLRDLAIVHYLVQRGYDLQAVADVLGTIRRSGLEQAERLLVRWDERRQRLVVEALDRGQLEQEIASGTFSLTVIPLRELQRQIREKMTTGSALAAERVRWRLHRAGWDEPPHQVQVGQAIRFPGRHRRVLADYVLRHGEWGPIAVVEVKAGYLPADAGLAQAKRAASVLGVRFAYATNGVQVVEHDLITGATAWQLDFPTPQELWQRLRVSATNQTNRQVDG